MNNQPNNGDTSVMGLHGIRAKTNNMSKHFKLKPNRPLTNQEITYIFVEAGVVVTAETQERKQYFTNNQNWEEIRPIREEESNV